MREPIRPIRPHLLANKIERIQNYEYPHLLAEFGNDSELTRVLWFLQYVSFPENYAGGLSKIAADLITSQYELIGSKRSQEVGFGAKSYTIQQAIDVLRELPVIAREKLFGDEHWRVLDGIDDDQAPGPAKKTRSRNSPLMVIETDRSRPRCDLQLIMKTVTPAAVKRLCVDAAEQDLASYLKQVCELPHVGLREYDPAKDRNAYGRAVLPGQRYWGCERDAAMSGLPRCGAPWFFFRVADALQSFIENRKSALRHEIAETEITRIISRWINKSRNTREPVMIVGNSRFGKTETIKLCAKLNPEVCRLVDTREGNALGDLVREVAKSLGMEIGPENSLRDLRDRIDFVLRYSRLQLLFDESQFLLPASYSRSTAPARLNWVRRNIMDQSIPAVFVCTPQSYLPAKKQFVDRTGFAMQQFDERFLKTVFLPDEICEDDLLAIARIHFPDLAEDYLRFVVNKALATERNFVSDIKRIAALAKDEAREHGRKLPILADIKAAIADVLPTAPAEGVPTRQVFAVKPSKNWQSVRATKPDSDDETLQNFSRQTRVAALNA